MVTVETITLEVTATRERGPMRRFSYFQAGLSNIFHTAASKI